MNLLDHINASLPVAEHRKIGPLHLFVIDGIVYTVRRCGGAWFAIASSPLGCTDEDEVQTTDDVIRLGDMVAGTARVRSV